MGAQFNSVFVIYIIYTNMYCCTVQYILHEPPSALILETLEALERNYGSNTVTKKKTVKTVIPN